MHNRAWALSRRTLTELQGEADERRLSTAGDKEALTTAIIRDIERMDPMNSRIGTPISDADDDWEPKPSRQPRQTRRVSYKDFAIAAAIVVIAALIVWFLFMRPDNSGSNKSTGAESIASPTPSTSPTPTTNSTPTATGTTTSKATPSTTKTSSDTMSKAIASGQLPWTPSAPESDLNNDTQFDKTTIELAKEGRWTHRVFNARLFNAANNWGGADSWYASLNIGPNTGGAWTSYGNPSEIIYRATSTQVGWCVSILTTSTFKAEFLSNTNDPSQVVGFNVKTAPNTMVAVMTQSGQLKTGTTSDLGDILVQLPNDGVTTICTAFTSAAPTSESRLHWGPDDRPTEAIDRIDAQK